METNPKDKPFFIKESNIHGVGVFAARDLFIGEDLNYNFLTKNIDPNSRFRGFNHSCYPNAELVASLRNIIITRHINKYEEITLGYGATFKPDKCNCPDCRELNGS